MAWRWGQAGPTLWPPSPLGDWHLGWEQTHVTGSSNTNLGVCTHGRSTDTHPVPLPHIQRAGTLVVGAACFSLLL